MSLYKIAKSIVGDSIKESSLSRIGSHVKKHVNKLLLDFLIPIC